MVRNGLAVCTAPGRQIEAAVFPDGANGVIIGWEDFRSSELVPDVYAQRVNSAGAPQWTANGVKLVAGSLVANNVVGAPDGTGGALVAWDHSNGADLDLYSVRYDGAGALVTGWNASGNAVVTAAQDQTDLSRLQARRSVIVSRVDQRKPRRRPECLRAAAGVAPASRNGFPMASSWTAASGSQSTFMVPDGAGGSIVMWNDAFGSLAQRIDGAGVPQWTAGGVTMLGPGLSISMVGADGLGGAMAASGGFSWNLAQRVNGAGRTCGVRADSPWQTRWGSSSIWSPTVPAAPTSRGMRSTRRRARPTSAPSARPGRRTGLGRERRHGFCGRGNQDESAGCARRRGRLTVVWNDLRSLALACTRNASTVPARRCWRPMACPGSSIPECKAAPTRSPTDRAAAS
jgi:hypothetical protein